MLVPKYNESAMTSSFHHDFKMHRHHGKISEQGKMPNQQKKPNYPSHAANSPRGLLFKFHRNSSEYFVNFH